MPMAIDCSCFQPWWEQLCTAAAGGQCRDTAVQTAERLWVLIVHHRHQLSRVQSQGTLWKRWQNEYKSGRRGNVLWNAVFWACRGAMYMTSQQARWHSQDLYVIKTVRRQMGILRSYPEWRSYWQLMAVWEGRVTIFRSMANEWCVTPH